MVILGTQDNTVKPKDAGGAWECVGEWRNSSGVAVGPHHVLAAGHTGDHVEGTFRMEGVVYPAVESWEVGPDLRLIRVGGAAMPRWADLYRGTEEMGKEVLMIGFGCVRGEAVMNGEVQNGWRWGEHGKKSWGINVIDEVKCETVDGIAMECLCCTMSAERGATVGSYAAYDSGGGTFIREGGRWKLAGINASVDPKYVDPKTGKEFHAAIWNGAGMTPGKPITSIAVRVSAYVAAIDAVLNGAL